MRESSWAQAGQLWVLALPTPSSGAGARSQGPENSYSLPVDARCRRALLDAGGGQTPRANPG